MNFAAHIWGHIRKEAKQDTSAIALGGIITHIARHFDYVEPQGIQDNSLYTHGFLLNAHDSKFIGADEHGNYYEWMFHRKRLINYRLPNPELPQIQPDQEDYKLRGGYNTDSDDEEEQPQPMSPQQQHQAPQFFQPQNQQQFFPDQPSFQQFQQGIFDRFDTMQQSIVQGFEGIRDDMRNLRARVDQIEEGMNNQFREMNLEHRRTFEPIYSYFHERGKLNPDLPHPSWYQPPVWNDPDNGSSYQGGGGGGGGGDDEDDQ